ncbi:AFR014Cp [Eremothecium gossypii ATCC 10895]|uniref:AFR014Cp n=1 Tax=Eremothecium gossypii (strain ATCC 10895 / CBS 109.51 / FGSC 9923 / NRRL Y-1056) TaxID=284811 RepID=Q754Q8_EREGS|nr:AFR014Cp [Eremothecium gossypii ATCC 10895]AAS53385.1 AFR014Cp [Eremothecium gossypii ATCC 10895]AEY97696.1 FAFR014Cp [Eremothecium gossypii FDAG1]
MDANSDQRDKHNQYIAELREQDRWLPINNVARLMKNTLPVTTKVSKDAKECMQECVSEFISFVTSEASDRCASDKRKTINGEDVLISLHALGFENYAEVLKIYLAKYRQQQALKNQMIFQRREDGADGLDGAADDGSDDAGEEEGEHGAGAAAGAPGAGALPEQDQFINQDGSLYI